LSNGIASTVLGMLCSSGEGRGVFPEQKRQPHQQKASPGASLFA
jgi:hypothetical protein